MTPFEYAVLALLLLFSVTNVCKLVSSSRLAELPGGYIHVVFACICIAIISIVNLVVNLVIGA